MKKYNMAILLLFTALCLLLSAGCATIQKQEGPDSRVSIRELDRSKETAIKASFQSDKVLAGEDIHVKVVNLEATLTGTVETQEYKDLAGKVASSVQGIKKVENNLEIRKKVE